MDPLLQQIASDLRELKPRIERQKMLLGVARAAGEDTSALESSLRQLEAKIAKWENALAGAGVRV